METDQETRGERIKTARELWKITNAVKQRGYQDNYNRRQKAARARLGLTIAQFKQLPAEERLAALAGRAVAKTAQPSRSVNYYAKMTPEQKKARADRQRLLRHEKAAKAGRPIVSRNGPLPRGDRSIKFCPHCGWNIDATAKAQAFIDGRVA